MKNPAHIIITGGSNGIGAALAMHYAAPGVTLCLTGRNEARLARVAEACRGRGAEVVAAAIDVRDHMTLSSWLQDQDARRRVDLVIANAGISGGSGGKAVQGEDPAQLKHILAVNLDGVINTVTPLIPAMVKRGRGQIALMSSLAGLRGMPSAPGYSTSKAAVLAYGAALRGWLGPLGVEASVIMPGFTRTNMTSQNPFPMPFMVEPVRAALIIERGLARNQARIAFPWQLYLPMLLLSQLPQWLTDPLFSRLPNKPSIEASV